MMNLLSFRFLALAGTALTLAACSAEPSDWRPGEKVSIDMVEPGTRPTGLQVPYGDAAAGEAVEGHAGSTEAEPSHGAPAMAEPVNEAVTGGERDAQSAESAMTANAEEGMRKRGELNDAGKSSMDDTLSK